MVTGTVPFPGKNPSDVMHRHLKQELVPPDHLNPSLSPGFSQIIEMMMAKEVSRRYQNASDVIEDLDTVARGETPHFAQPTLDFAMLAEVAQTSPTSEPIPQATPSADETTLASIWFPMLIVSAIVNLILFAILLIR
jgi:serine/threonine-protein kinase